MIRNPQVRARRVHRLFSDAGPLPATIQSSLEPLEPGVSASLAAALCLEGAETVLMVALVDLKDWCVLTTERLSWSSAGTIHHLIWEEVTGVQQPPALSARIIRGETPKDEAEELEVFNASGSAYQLKLPMGAAYYMVWSAIAALGNISRRPDEIRLDTR